jgi:hypothetical protein
MTARYTRELAVVESHRPSIGEEVINRMTLTVACLWAVACNGEKATEPVDSVDTDLSAEGCETHDECDDFEICGDSGTCIDGDLDNAYEDAAVIRQGEVGEGIIHPDGDVDFYVYETTGPEWIRIDTRTNVDDCVQTEADSDDPHESEVNTVVEIREENGALYAAMNNSTIGQVGYSFTNFDSVLHAYLPSAGNWYITVQDWTSWSDDAPTLLSGTDFVYCLEVKPFSDTTSEPDTIEGVSLTDTVREGNIAVIGALIETDGDSDYVTLTVENTHPMYALTHTDVAGSTATPMVRLHDGLDVLSEKQNLGTDGYLMYFSPDTKDYTLELTDTLGAGGDNNWFVVHMMSIASDTLVEELEPNDKLSEPHALTTETRFTDSNNTPYEYAYVTGALVEDGDKDVFTVAANADEYLSIRCTSDAVGSLGLLQGEFLDTGKNSVATSLEGNDEAPDIDNYLVTSAGDHYIRITAEDDGEFGLGSYYSCSVYLTPFEATF